MIQQSFETLIQERNVSDKAQFQEKNESNKDFFKPLNF